MPPARAHTVAVSRSHTIYDGAEDEEDICPVCEGECTCNNVVESITASNFADFNRQVQAKTATSNTPSHTSTSNSASAGAIAATSSNPTKFPSALPAGFRPSSTKGLPRPPSSYAIAAASPSPSPSNIAPRLQSLKLRLSAPAKNSDGTISDSSTSTIDAPHNQTSAPQLARFTLPKHASTSASGTATPRNPLDDRIPPAHTPKMVPPKVIAKAKGKGKVPVERKSASVVKKSAQGNPKKPTLATTKKRKLGRPHKKRIRETTSESSLSDFDDFDEDDFLPYRGPGQTQQSHIKRKRSMDPESGFATFVSASVFEGSGSESGSESETSVLGMSGDSEIEAEEEKLILAEEEEQRQRKLRELLMGSNHQNHNGGGGGGQQWQIKPRRKSVEGQESDDETSSDSGAGEEEEEEDEDDPDEDEADGDEAAAAWSTDDEEDLFFANLSDSSMSFSADQDDEDDDDSETVSSTADLAEAANAGFLSGMGGMGMPMVVMEDFGASLGLGMGLGNVLDATDLDLEFEQRARAQLAEEKRSPEPLSADVFSADYDYTKDAMDAISGLEMDIDEEDTDATEYEEDSDMDGESTADEMERGRTPSRFRFPTPPTINPLATFTPTPATSPVGWRDFTPTHFRPTPFARGAPHTRAASFDGFVALDMIRGRTISAGATTGTPGPNLNGSDGSMSEISNRPPVMGSFGRAGDRRRAAIIDGNGTVPSPFAARRRRSDSWKSGRKHFGTKSDIFPMLARRARQNSITTQGSGRSSFHFPTEPEMDMDMDMESCTEPFELDDVLDFSNVSDEHHHGSHAQGQGTDLQGETHLRSLDRWDRVPMGTFRRTREAHDTGVVPGASTSDGFSYGAASRGTWEGDVLWGGGLGTLGEEKALLSSVTAGSEDSLGNAGTSGGFEKAVSRKERRRRKKLAAAVPTKSFITPPPSRKN